MYSNNHAMWPHCNAVMSVKAVVSCENSRYRSFIAVTAIGHWYVKSLLLVAFYHYLATEFTSMFRLTLSS